MKNSLIYLLTVLIWGSTWLAIEFQLGEVAIEASLVYRFSLAALLILVFCLLNGYSLKLSLKQHGSIVLLGLLNFCINYVSLYHAQKYLSSAMTSIGFSTLLIMNIVNTRLFFGKKIELKTYVGAFLGVLGILCLFWPEISKSQSNENALYGLIFVFAGTLSASLGNMVSVKNSQNHFPLLQSTGWGMLYGSLFLWLFALYNQTPFTFSSQPSYWLSLVYLTLFGTVIAFLCYFYLLKNIGPEKASYTIVLFPVVAVILSSLFEGFEWNIYVAVGFCLVGMGNLLVLVPINKIRLRINELVFNPLVVKK